MRKKRNFKNCILNGTAMFASIIFVLSACCLDSESWIPLAMCVASAGWLALFCMANDWFEVYKDSRWEK